MRVLDETHAERSTTSTKWSELNEKERKQCMEEQGIFIERILSNENMNRAYKQVKKNKVRQE